MVVAKWYRNSSLAVGRQTITLTGFNSVLSCLYRSVLHITFGPLVACANVHSLPQNFVEFSFMTRESSAFVECCVRLLLIF